MQLTNNTNDDYTIRQLKLPLEIEKLIDIADPVYTFCEVMDRIDLTPYFVDDKDYKTGRPRCDAQKLLKVILFAFMERGISFLREKREKVFEKISELIDAMNREVLGCFGIKFETREEYAVDYLEFLLKQYREITGLDTTTFVNKRGHHKTLHQRQYQKLEEYPERLKSYAKHIEICKGSPYRAECCKSSKKNRIIRLNRELTAFHEEVISNLESIQGALLCMNRSIQSEGTFGIIKWDRSYKRLFRRGIENVILELTLISCGYNLYKYHNKKKRDCYQAA